MVLIRLPTLPLIGIHIGPVLLVVGVLASLERQRDPATQNPVGVVRVEQEWRNKEALDSTSGIRNGTGFHLHADPSQN